MDLRYEDVVLDSQASLDSVWLKLRIHLNRLLGNYRMVVRGEWDL